MSQLSHTPGPVIATGGTIQVDSPPHFIAIVGAPSDRGIEDLANARLLAAAYNAFDSAAKNLGINAVEFAERMQESGLAELFEALDYAMMLIQEPADGTNLAYATAALRKARAALAKVKGTA